MSAWPCGEWLLAGVKPQQTLSYFFSIILIRIKKQSVKELVLVMRVQTKERKVEDTKDESELGMKLKTGIFTMGRMKKSR